MSLREKFDIEDRIATIAGSIARENKLQSLETKFAWFQAAEFLLRQWNIKCEEARKARRTHHTELTQAAEREKAKDAEIERLKAIINDSVNLMLSDHLVRPGDYYFMNRPDVKAIVKEGE